MDRGGKPPVACSGTSFSRQYLSVMCILLGLQIVLMKDKKKCFAIDNPGFEPEVVAVHPGGGMAAVGGTVRVLFSSFKVAFSAH